MERKNAQTGIKTSSADWLGGKRDETGKPMPVYEMPRIMTYTDEQILEILGPAQTSVYP
jgi:hypothetical protein